MVLCSIISKFARVVSLCTLIMITSTQASEDIDDVNVRGFGALSVTHSNSSELGFRRDLTKDGVWSSDEWDFLADSVIGAQFDVALNDRLKATLQIVGKDNVENDVNSSIDWAYLTYQNNDQWVTRIGRVSVDLALLSEFYNVAYAYDAVRPSTEFYASVPITHFDGIDLTRRIYSDGGVYSVKWYLGNSDRAFKTYADEHYFRISPFLGMVFSYEDDSLIYRASYAHAELGGYQSSGFSELESAFQNLVAAGTLSESETSAILDDLSLKNRDVDYVTAGMEYRYQEWKFLTEASYLHSNSAVYYSYMAMYAGVTRRFDNVSLYGLLSHGHTTNSPHQESLVASGPFAAAVQTALDYIQRSLDYGDSKQTTTSLGSRWDLAPNLALKAQWDHSWVAKNKALLWVRASDQTAAQTVDTVTLSLNFIF
jgi:hypothetical protein